MLLLYPPDASGGYYGFHGGTPPQCVDDFSFPLQPKVLALEASNLQDRFNGTKACLRVFLASFPKTRWPPRPFYSNF